jgi:hypothetical protein
VPDNIWEKMLVFFAKQFRQERKYCFDVKDERKNKSQTKEKSKLKEKEKKGAFSLDKADELKKKEKR